jgi:hypothetical protein
MFLLWEGRRFYRILVGKEERCVGLFVHGTFG